MKWEVNDKRPIPLFLSELEYILNEGLVTLQAACTSYFIQPFIFKASGCVTDRQFYRRHL